MLPLRLPRRLSHRVSLTVSLTASPTASPSPSLSPCLSPSLQVAPDADWVEAARRLDMPELRVDTEASWRTLLALFRAGTGEPFPLDSLVAAPGASGLWRNEVSEG